MRVGGAAEGGSIVEPGRPLSDEWCKKARAPISRSAGTAAVGLYQFGARESIKYCYMRIAVDPLIDDQKATVLVVDDTPANLKLLYELLKDECSVRTESNGAKAIAICQSDSRPDLVLLDVMTPEMDGYEVCRQLKEDPRSRDVPVIFVTAKTDIEDEQKGLE